MRQRASQVAEYFGSLKFSAKDGSFEYRSSQPNSEWEELDTPVNLIINLGGMRTGWRRLEPGAYDVQYWAEPFSGVFPDEPEANRGLDREQKPWSKTMTFLCTGGDLGDEIFEWAAGSRIVMGGLDDLLDDFEAAGGKGGVGGSQSAKVQLVGSTKVKTKNGSFHAPKFGEKIQLIDASDLFGGKDICTPDKLVGGAASPAPAPQPPVAKPAPAEAASDDDDGDFF